MADVSDPAIAAAYDDVRNDKSETSWLLLDYESDKSNKLVLTAKASPRFSPDISCSIR